MKKNKKTISIIKEKKVGERRTILLPEDLRIFIQNGYDVYVERGTGSGIGISDKEYANIGAKIVSTKQAWTQSNVIFKYKPPVDSEFRYINADKHIGAVFHAEGNKELTDKLLKSKCTAYTYEFFKTKEGIFPASVASSEIAGKVAVIFAAYHLQNNRGGSGVLLAPVVNVKPPKVVVIGYGNAGGSAARMAATMGGRVVVFGTNREKLRAFQSSMPIGTECFINTPKKLREELQDADIVIGAILISTYDTKPIITKEMVKKMKKGSIIMDVTCGYGSGYIETFDHNTTLENPVFSKYGVLHCKVDVLPSAYSVTTVQAMSKHLSYYLYRMAEGIYAQKPYDVAEAGKIVQNGKIVHFEVQRHMEHWNEIK